LLTSGSESYKTHGSRVPLPAKKNTSIPPVQGTVTDRYKCFRRKCTHRDRTFNEEQAARRETSLFESKLKYMSAYVDADT